MIRLKNNNEIEGIRRSCHLLADLFRTVLPKIKAGMSTKDVDEMCHMFMKKHGGKPAWFKENFPAATCISVNDEVIHGVPSKKKIIKQGDLVSIDIGIDLDGYISDSTHSVIVGGEGTEKVRTLHRVTLECLEAGIRSCVAGNRISDISNAVFSLAKKHGYGVVREYCGHGVGLGVHEDPSIPNYPDAKSNKKIQKGMVLAIEPMINLGGDEVYTSEENGWTVMTSDHSVSCHEEHTVAVFADHTEILTALDYDK